MMFFLLALAMTAATPVPVPAPHAGPSVHSVADTEDSPIKRGAPIGESPRVSLDSVLRNPDAFVGTSVIVEGNVGAVCTRKGCWMEISQKEGDKGIRVTFKDYGFFVPTDSEGLLVLAEGEVQLNPMSKDDVEHLESEGATVQNKQPDGSALELAFVATGVELRKK